MNLDVLRAIANATAANTVLYVTAQDGKPLLDAGYITVNTDQRDPSDANKVAASITSAGATALAQANGAAPADHKPAMSSFNVIKGSGIELPKVARGFKKGVGGGGREAKYPFETMEVGDIFFIANTAVKNNDAVKTLGSAAGSANQRFAKPVLGADGKPVTKSVKRAKRGHDHKAVKGADGKNVMEDAVVEEKTYTRKFVVRPVKAGVKYGEWLAPADGAVVQREA